MLELQRYESDVRQRYFVRGPAGAVSAEFAMIPVTLAHRVDDDLGDLTVRLGVPLPPMVVQYGNEAWLEIDVVLHTPDPEGQPCELVEGGRCSIWGPSNFRGILADWLAADKDDERLQVRLDALYAEHLGRRS